VVGCLGVDTVDEDHARTAGQSTTPARGVCQRKSLYRQLLGAVAQNPRLLGVGIDENTAEGKGFEVVGMALS